MFQWYHKWKHRSLQQHFEFFWHTKSNNIFWFFYLISDFYICILVFHIFIRFQYSLTFLKIISLYNHFIFFDLWDSFKASSFEFHFELFHLPFFLVIIKNWIFLCYFQILISYLNFSKLHCRSVKFIYLFENFNFMRLRFLIVKIK